MAEDTAPETGADRSDADAEAETEAAGRSDGGDEATREELAARVDALSDRVDQLEDTIDDQRFVISMLTVYADLTPLDPAECPECGQPALTKRSGLTWSKGRCSNCGTEWVLDK
jgi:hypothetical protein